MSQDTNEFEQKIKYLKLGALGLILLAPVFYLVFNIILDDSDPLMKYLIPALIFFEGLFLYFVMLPKMIKKHRASREPEQDDKHS